jgi:hypothetical protein
MPVWVRFPARGAPKRSPIRPGTGRSRRSGPFATGVVPREGELRRRAAIVAGPTTPSTLSPPYAAWKFFTALFVIGPNTASIAPGG